MTSLSIQLLGVNNNDIKDMLPCMTSGIKVVAIPGHLAGQTMEERQYAANYNSTILYSTVQY